MNSLNTAAIVGRLTRDSETKYTASGLAICNFSVAFNTSQKDGDKWKEVSHFLDLSLFGKQAEALGKYLTKGKLVAIQGHLEQQRWEKDGQKHSKIVVKVDGLQLLTPGEGQGQESKPYDGPTFTQGQAAGQSFEDDEIPF